MKRLILCFVLIVSLFAIRANAQLTPTQVGTIHYDCSAMEVDSNGDAIFYMADVYENESDNNLVVRIFNPQNFEVMKEFKVSIAGNKRYAELELKCGGRTGMYVVVFKNFFIKNDKWTVILGTYGGENVQYYVISETGENVGNLNTALNDSPLSLEIYLSGVTQGKPVLAKRFKGEDSYGYVIYTFTGSSLLNAVKVGEVQTRAYPNPLPEGAQLTVNFEREADEATFFVVNDMNGRQVERKKIREGETEIRLNGLHFGHGHYIYTVIFGDGTSVSGRLMAD